MTSRAQVLPNRHRLDGDIPIGPPKVLPGSTTGKPTSSSHVSGYPTGTVTSSTVIGRNPVSSKDVKTSGIKMTLKRSSTAQPIENRIEAVLRQSREQLKKEPSGQVIQSVTWMSTPVGRTTPTTPGGDAHSLLSPLSPDRQYNFSARSATAHDAVPTSPVRKDNPPRTPSTQDKTLYVKGKGPVSEMFEYGGRSPSKRGASEVEHTNAVQKRSSSSSCDELYNKLDSSQCSDEHSESQPHLSKIHATVVAEISRLSRLIDSEKDNHQLRELQEMKENAEELLEQIDGEAHQVTEELAQVKRERDAAQGERETAEAQSEALRKQRDELQDRLRATQADMETLKRAVTKAEEERESHLRDLQSVNRRKEELEKQILETQATKSDLQEKSSRLSRVKEMLHDLEADKERLSKMLEEERRDREDLMEQLTRLEDWKSHLQQENTKLQGYADQVVVVENSLETLEGQKQHFEELAQDHVQELDQLKLCLAEMSKDNADLSKRLEIAEKDQAELKQRVTKLEAISKVQKETIQRVEHQRDELAQKAEHAFRRAAAANLEKDKSDEALQRTQEELQIAKDENRLLKSRIESLTEGYARADFSRTLDGWLTTLQEANEDISVLIDKDKDPLNGTNVTLLLAPEPREVVPLGYSVIACDADISK